MNGKYPTDAVAGRRWSGSCGSAGNWPGAPTHCHPKARVLGGPKSLPWACRRDLCSFS